MNREIDLGKVYLPEELIKMVERYQYCILSSNRHTDYHFILAKADFSTYFSDFIIKNFDKIKENLNYGR